jgi:hypothetical protein
VRKTSSAYLPECYEKSVEVTGQFGWSAVPDDIRTATTITGREAAEAGPRGSVRDPDVRGIDGGAIRIARIDPDVAAIVAVYSRIAPFV